MTSMIQRMDNRTTHDAIKYSALFILGIYRYLSAPLHPLVYNTVIFRDESN